MLIGCLGYEYKRFMEGQSRQAHTSSPQHLTLWGAWQLCVPDAICRRQIISLRICAQPAECFYFIGKVVELSYEIKKAYSRMGYAWSSQYKIELRLWNSLTFIKDQSWHRAVPWLQNDVSYRFNSSRKQVKSQSTTNNNKCSMQSVSMLLVLE